MKLAYIKWFPRDWLSEHTLRVSSPAARGLWADALCLMASGEKYGYLQQNGKPMTDDQLARLTGTDKDTVKECVKEWKDNGVCDLTEDGIVISRRMIRDEQKRRAGVRTGKFGGNPILTTLSSSRGHSPETTLGLTVNPTGTVKGQAQPVDFTAFWLAYPRKAGKVKAYQAWCRADLPSLDKILSAIERAKESEQWQKNGGQYIPYPATWIHRGGWDDELPPANSHKPRDLTDLY